MKNIITKNNIKFYFIILALYMICSSFIFFDDDSNIQFVPYEYLPDNIYEFVDTYFGEYEVYVQLFLHTILLFLKEAHLYISAEKENGKIL